MKRLRILASAAVALFGLVMAGCGGGGGGGTAPANGFTKGVVTAKGSVTVNGIKFDTSSSDVTIDDSARSKGDDSGIKVGMVVKIKGSVSGATGTATKIEFADNLEGVIDAGTIDAVNSTFKVFGQTVKAGPATIIEESGTGQILFSALAAGNAVEISGVPDNTGVINATRIERKSGITEFELKGKVSAYVSGGLNFTLTPTNSATPVIVTIGAATLPANFAPGMNVEVKTTGSGSTITATRIEVENELQPAEDEHVEVRGIISGFSTTSFVVNGVTVDPNGLSTGLGNGVEVEVEGTFRNGVLVASKIELEQENHVKLEGNVAATADIGASSIKLNGVTVTVNSSTLFKDSDNSGGKTPVVSFGLANVAAGDHLEIVGFVDGSGSVVAAKIERMKASSLTIVQGPVSAENATANTLTILGITVNIGNTSLKDAAEAPVGSPTTFFALVIPGTTVVKTKGSLSGTTLTATEAEIES